MVVLFDEFLQVCIFRTVPPLCFYASFQSSLYPATPATQVLFAKMAASPSFPLPFIFIVKTVKLNPWPPISIHESSTILPPVAYSTWSLSLPLDIQALLSAAAREPVASVGKVLGNRTNILIPRLFTVLTVSTTSQCVVFMSWIV